MDILEYHTGKTHIKGILSKFKNPNEEKLTYSQIECSIFFWDKLFLHSASQVRKVLYSRYTDILIVTGFTGVSEEGKYVKLSAFPFKSKLHSN